MCCCPKKKKLDNDFNPRRRKVRPRPTDELKVKNKIQKEVEKNRKVVRKQSLKRQATSDKLPKLADDSNVGLRDDPTNQTVLKTDVDLPVENAELTRPNT